MISTDYFMQGEWEQALTEEELLTLQELGLGVAVDITAKHPWATKSAFLAKKVNKHDKEKLPLAHHDLWVLCVTFTERNV